MAGMGLQLLRTPPIAVVAASWRELYVMSVTPPPTRKAYALEEGEDGGHPKYMGSLNHSARQLA